MTSTEDLVRLLRQRYQDDGDTIARKGADEIDGLKDQLARAKGIIAALCMTAKRSKYTEAFWKSVDEILVPSQSSATPREESK